MKEFNNAYGKCSTEECVKALLRKAESPTRPVQDVLRLMRFFQNRMEDYRPRVTVEEAVKRYGLMKDDSWFYEVIRLNSFFFYEMSAEEKTHFFETMPHAMKRRFLAVGIMTGYLKATSYTDSMNRRRTEILGCPYVQRGVPEDADLAYENFDLIPEASIFTWRVVTDAGDWECLTLRGIN